MKFVIASGKGGVGKSMLTSALAMLFAKDRKVVAVDCDVDAPNLAIWLGGVKKWDKISPVVTSAKPKINFKESRTRTSSMQGRCDGCGVCAENCRFEAIAMVKRRPKLNPFLCEGCGACAVICPQRAIKMKPVQNGEIQMKKTKYGFPLVSGQLYPGETGSGKVVAEIKKTAEKFYFEIMLIDSAPGTGCPVIASLQDSNFAILITEPTPSGFSDLKRVLEVVNHFRVPYGIVINKWDIYKNLSQKIEKWAGKEFLGRISYDQEILRAISSLKPILETNLNVKEEIKEIFKKLKNQMPKLKI